MRRSLWLTLPCFLPVFLFPAFGLLSRCFESRAILSQLIFISRCLYLHKHMCVHAYGAQCACISEWMCIIHSVCCLYACDYYKCECMKHNECSTVYLLYVPYLALVCGCACWKYHLQAKVKRNKQFISFSFCIFSLISSVWWREIVVIASFYVCTADNFK